MSALIVGFSALAFVLLLLLLVDRRDVDAEPAFEAAVRARVPPPLEEPASLKSARWLVVNAVSAGGLHYRVRPVLVELTVARLRDSHGIDLAHPRAATVVGDALWQIVRPDAPAPHDRMAPGMSPSMLRDALDRLEML